MPTRIAALVPERDGLLAAMPAYLPTAKAFAREAQQPTGTEVLISKIAQAQHEADVVCACTHSPDPVVFREHLSDGAHVNSVGYNTAGREVDERTVVDALVVVESRAAV